MDLFVPFARLTDSPLAGVCRNGGRSQRPNYACRGHFLADDLTVVTWLTTH